MIEPSLTTKLTLSIFRAIPLGVRKACFVSLSLLAYHLLPRRRLITIHNLQRAFPEKGLSEIRGIAKGVYRNFGIVAAEFFDMPLLTKENIGDYVDVEGLENCQKALEKNKGLLMFSAHFGNWELQAIAFSLLIQPVVVIYRPLDNPILENIVTWVRSSTGNIAIDKSHAMRQMLRHLKNRGILGLLIDQNWSWQEGCFVDFFGRPACTTNGLALLALHTEAPVIPAFMARMPDGKYRFFIGEEVEITRTGDRELDIVTNTQRFTRIIEDMVRRYPDQWFWVHQRWKTHPCQVIKDHPRSMAS
jgi:KDO2-lipid IV(A) lauroyltransferase